MTGETEQAKELKAAQEKLQMTKEEFAERMGVELATLVSWMRPTSSKAHRPMTKTAKFLLAYLLVNKGLLRQAKKRRQKA